MAPSGNPEPKRPNPPRQKEIPSKKPLQVMHISKKQEKEENKSNEQKLEMNSDENLNTNNSLTFKGPVNKNQLTEKSIKEIQKPKSSRELKEGFEMTMEDFLRKESSSFNSLTHSQNINSQIKNGDGFTERIVDDFDFDEDAFLAALDENEPIGNTGEIAKGKVIGVESDGVYVDIGGKAPGFMPKNECGLGVITNIKERFPKDLEVEVLVTREQNADGMVTISCRALELRKSWAKVQELEKAGKVVQVKINGFNRGGVTCELEGLRGFIPRSHLEQGENHEKLVAKSLGVAFIEVNPETRKLILSEKKASIVSRFAELKVGELVDGKVVSIKPYGFFVDLGGISGLLHQTAITNGSIRSLREIFKQGDQIKALITDLDPRRGRIGLNTALLEGPPGEILEEKEKVMAEADERALKAKTLILKKNESAEG